MDEIGGVANKSFHSLFRSNIQFQIPFFQRGYAWEKKHWQQLFEDIEEGIVSDLDFDQEFNDVEHFFGPIVVLEKRNSSPDMKQFQIIDGQQRITTIYLLIAIIRNLLQEKAHESQQANEYVATLNRYLINETESADDYLKLKLFSGKGDRLPTYYLLFGRTNPNSKYLQTDQQLYNPKTNKIDIFSVWAQKKIKKDFGSVPRLWQLAQIVLQCLKIVWIPLDDQKDDPQAIFESLNDRGMPLSASELLCNYVFKPLIDANESYEQLHNNVWLKTINSIDQNGRFEDYLRTLITIGQKKVIGKGRRIYTFYKMKHKRMNVSDAKSFLKDLHGSYPSYNTITNPVVHRHPTAEINNILINLNSTRMDACNPFLLAVLKSLSLGLISQEDSIDMLQEAYVFVVRRKMCEMPTQKYDLIFPNLLGRIINEPNKAKAIREILISEAYYVSNQEFKDALVNRPLYRPRDLPFTRMVLRELDKIMQSFNQLPDYTTLPTVEHVLPQTVDSVWKSYLENDASDPELLKYTNTLGNLCLLSQPANSHAGQDPFDAKKRDYTDVSALTRDVKDRDVTWNIQAIKDRSKDLSEHALDIWKWNNEE